MIERFIVWESHLPNKIDGYLESDPSLSMDGKRDVIFNGARLMLGKGYDPNTLLTMRWRGKAFDSFKPQKISVLAKLVSSETDGHGPRIVAYSIPPQWRKP